MFTVRLFLSVTSTMHSSEPDVISELHDKGKSFVINHVCLNFNLSNPHFYNNLQPDQELILTKYPISFLRWGH